MRVTCCICTSCIPLPVPYTDPTVLRCSRRLQPCPGLLRSSHQVLPNQMCGCLQFFSQVHLPSAYGQHREFGNTQTLNLESKASTAIEGPPDAMSLAVDVPGFGWLSLPWAVGLTADDVIRLAQSRLPEPWHGNKLLSSGLQQLGPNEIITQQTALHGVVLANFSEISAEDSSFCFCSPLVGVVGVPWHSFTGSRKGEDLKEACSIAHTAERGISLEQLRLLVRFISKMADRWFETYGANAGSRLTFGTFNLYHANHWIIKPATQGYHEQNGCSLVEVMALDPHVQKPRWFVSHAWIDARYKHFGIWLISEAWCHVGSLCS